LSQFEFINSSLSKEKILNKTIWRYYSIPKFISLINNKELRFSTPVIFEDPIDGISKKSYLRALELKDRYKRAIDMFYNLEKKKEDKTLEDLGNKLNSGTVDFKNFNLSQFIDQLENDRNIQDHVKNLRNIYVNCWHMNQNESLAMWDLYVGRNTPGIAIKTTVRKLINEINIDVTEKGLFGKVIYKNENSNDIFKETFIKRPCFQYENEFRIAIENYNNAKGGICKKINLNNLIEEIYITPRIKNWEQNTILDLIKKYNQYNDNLSNDCPIKKSDLMNDDIKPLFYKKNNFKNNLENTMRLKTIIPKK
jgi:hypothetical protein